MNYLKIYNSLVNRARNRFLTGYTERHHIIPRCMGGSDDPNNLVDLTPEEHFLCHILLVKLYPNYPNLIFALHSMCYNGVNTKRVSRSLYGQLKRAFSSRMKEISSGETASQYGTVWVSNPVEKINKKIKSGDSIPEGFFLGRNIWNRKPPGPGKGNHKSSALKNKIKDPSAVLQRYLAGERMIDIGIDFGVSGTAIIHFLNAQFPDRQKFAPGSKRNKSLVKGPK